MRKYLASLFVAFVALNGSSIALAAEVETTPAETVAAIEAAVALNSADAGTLERELAGVGAAKAKAIVDYRDAHGPFASVEELLEVKGIGTAILEKNRARLTLN